MGVHIDQLGIDFKIEYIEGVTAVVEDVLVGLSHRDVDQFVTHEASIDIEELLVLLASRKRREAHPAMEAES